MSEKKPAAEVLGQAALTALLDSADLIIYVKDPAGRYTYANRGLCNFLNASASEIIGASHVAMLDPADALAMQTQDMQVLQEQRSLQDIVEIRVRGDLVPRTLFWLKAPLFDAHSRVCGLCGIAVEITDDMRNTEKVAAQNRMLYSILSNVDAPVFQKDEQGRYLYANQSVMDLYGRSIHEILGRTDLELLPQPIAEALMATDREVLSSKDRIVRQEIVTDVDDAEHIFWVVKMPLHLPGQPPSLLGFASEVTELLALRESLRRQKTIDELTGLRNRVLFEATLEEAIELAGRQSATLAVLIIDIDNFKLINSTYGQEVGDALLVSLAMRLDSSKLLQGSLARLSSNKFAAVLSHVPSPSAVADAANCARALIAAPFDVHDQRFFLTASIGASLFPDDGSLVQSLMANAEIAMFRAKEKGRDRVCFYSREIGAAIAERADLERALRESAANKEFELHYQPQIELASNRVRGVEALIRWPRPGYGLVSPAVFIPVAEHLGLIVGIGAWVIDQACRQLASWKASGLADITIAVNLSPNQLWDDELVPFVRQKINEYGIDPSRLEMEVTESLLMGNSEHAVEVLCQLRNLGINLAIDDFGTGYSSLSYLRQLPVSILKLDKSFITKIAHNARDADLCAGIISLSHKLGLAVVAEGVEDQHQNDLLRGMQCETIQGYYYSKPLPLHEVEAYIHRSVATGVSPE